MHVCFSLPGALGCIPKHPELHYLSATDWLWCPLLTEGKKINKLHAV